MASTINIKIYHKLTVCVLRQAGVQCSAIPVMEATANGPTRHQISN